MDAPTAITKIKAKILQIQALEPKARLCPEFKKWHRETHVLLARIFGPDAYQVGSFTSINFVYNGIHVLGDQGPFERKYRSALKDSAAILTSIYEEIEEFGLNSQLAASRNPLSSVEALLTRFHSVARQLRIRHSGRATLDIKDEYDVQDLLHSLLRIFFKDVRPEEWTPSYGGNASRMDFLLHEEMIVVEAKMTRKGLAAKEIVDQLLVDIGRYAEHPHCKTLVCFIYDPEGYIGNSAAVISDLEKKPGKVPVRVFVLPENN
ncbi:MAG TPA: hypothetical protein VN673_13870 [Clostridia bacterium]|nr:hypothetical protein [Clostridia bacterium]